jgi:hypothetical protein
MHTAQPPEHPPSTHSGVLPVLLATGTTAFGISCLLTQ